MQSIRKSTHIKVIEYYQGVEVHDFIIRDLEAAKRYLKERAASENTRFEVREVTIIIAERVVEIDI